MCSRSGDVTSRNTRCGPPTPYITRWPRTAEEARSESLLRTDAGVAVRAAAENSDRALLLGLPVRRLSTIVWQITGGLAALTYMLQAPFAGVKPGLSANGPAVLLPLLAAAVVARNGFAAGRLRGRKGPGHHGTGCPLELDQARPRSSTWPTWS